MSTPSFSLTKTFPPCPNPYRKDTSLPFLIDEMDFSAWFTSLANLNDLDKCHKILAVLQLLNNNYPPDRQQIPARTRLFFLEKLGSVVDPAATMLTLAASNGAAGEDSQNAISDNVKTELSVWSNLELAQAYSQLGQEELFEQEDYFSLPEKTLIVCNGLLAMGKALLYTSQVYTEPQSDFWHRCYGFYRLAKFEQLTNPELNPEANRIETSFKRILVFALCNTKQFSPQEIRAIYELLVIYSTYASLLASVPKKKFNGIPAVYLKGNLPPTVINIEEEGQNQDYLYIATVNVASKILEATYDRRTHHQPVDRLMLLRLAKTLTLNKQRKDPRAHTQSKHLGIMGFKAIVEFTRQKEIALEAVLAEDEVKNHAAPGEIRELDFEVDKTEEDGSSNGSAPSRHLTSHEFQVVEFADPAAIWREGKKEQSYTANVRVIDKSNKGYGLLWTDYAIKPQVGNVVGVLNKTLGVGLIRWLAQSKETGMFMGVELLGASAASVKVSNPGYSENAVFAIFLPDEKTVKQYASIIFLNQKSFKPSEFIFVHKNQKSIRYRVTKQQHLTSFINHLEVVRSY